jgi:hypothetical protein
MSYTRIQPLRSARRYRRGIRGLGQDINLSDFTAWVRQEAAQNPTLQEGTRQMYPWNSYSSYTLKLQQDVNAAFERMDSVCRVSEDGILGPLTCGAARATGETVPASCQSYATECPAVVEQIAEQNQQPVPAPTPPSPEPPPPPPPEPPPATPEVSHASMLAAGGILALIAVGGYAYAKSKGYVA